MVNRLTARDTTANTITLEQIKGELQESEARLSQQLQVETTKTSAEIQATAEERKFQYEIVKSELEKSSKSNSERAAVLLFLVRAGVLNTLRTDELKQMAEEQIANPTQEIVPQLNSQGSSIRARAWTVSAIPVCWEEVDPQQARQRALVQRSISASWEANSRVRFVGWGKCEMEAKGVRIAVRDEFPNTKGVGKFVDGIRDGVVLNFDFKNWSTTTCSQSSYKDRCLAATSIHEFGHVLGFLHENNRSDAPEHCQSLPGPRDTELLTPYDPFSIMNYCNREAIWDGTLSPSDIVELRVIYGEP